MFQSSCCSFSFRWFIIHQGDRIDWPEVDSRVENPCHQETLGAECPVIRTVAVESITKQSKFVQLVIGQTLAVCVNGFQEAGQKFFAHFCCLLSLSLTSRYKSSKYNFSRSRD